MDPNNSNPNNSIAGALTYPRQEDNVQPVPIQPRQPRNLQGLLRFAMEATKAEDAPGNSELGPLDEERRRFLEEALKSMTVDVVKVLQDSIKTLSNSDNMHSIQLGEPLPEEVTDAFENLMEYIHDIDIANDFYKLGGFSIFPVCFGCENEEVRAKAGAVLGESCQNNPFCQARALECGLLNVLLNLAQSERADALAKCLFAISCCTRQYEPACRELIAQGGCATLSQLLRDTDVAVRRKAAFLIMYLCRDHKDAKQQFIQNNIVKSIMELIRSGHDDTTEHLLRILLSLLEGLDTTVMEQATDVSLKDVLLQHSKHPQLIGDTYIEEKEYCDELLKILDGLPSLDVNGEVADR